MFYYAFFGLLTVGLMIFALTKDTMVYRFLLTDRASAIEQLARETRSEEFVVQSRAVADLVKFGGDDAIQVLIQVAQTTEHTIQQEAIAALGKLGGERAIHALIGLLEHDGLDTPIYASFALAKIGGPAVAPLIAVVDGKSPGSVPNAAGTLARIDDPAAQARLQAAFDNREWKVLVPAVEYYIGEGTPGTEAILIEGMNRSDDVMMASSLLNSGNYKLEDAARAWAKENGYKVTSFPFIGRDAYRIWGSGY